ncbi:MAG TPA: universal stress protein [Thermomicrobiales bacterium]
MDTTGPLPIQHILVPLDGSRLAESALGPAMSLAERLKARVTLLHILERRAPETIHGERHLTSAGEAEAYLTGIASRFADAGIPVEAHTHPSPEGDVAASIAVHARGHRADLIVLCAHGQGGLRDWLFGAIAQRVVRRSGAPVLMIRQALATTAKSFDPRRILVALDGTPEGEEILPVAITTAKAFGAAIELVFVVATLSTIAGDRAAAARLMPGATSAALDQESESARRYLRELTARLGGVDLPITGKVERGEAARMVLSSAAQADDSLVALATHGRAGLEGLWSASVGTKVIARSVGPLLLLGARYDTSRRR